MLGGRGTLFIGGSRNQQQVVLYVLLIDGRSTLGDTTRGQVGPQCAEIALEVYAFVIIKALVLNGDDGVFHGFRNLLALHRVAALAEDIGHVLALGIFNSGDARDITSRQILQVRLHGFVSTGNRYPGNAREGGKGQGEQRAYQDRRQGYLGQRFDDSHAPYTTWSPLVGGRSLAPPKV